MRRIGEKSKALKASAKSRSNWVKLKAGTEGNDTRARAGDELVRLLAGENP
jgi:hypothetical protein